MHLRPSEEVAHELRHEELEAAALRALVPGRHGVVRVQHRVRHPRVHAAVYEACDAEDAAAARVEGAGDAVGPGAVGVGRELVPGETFTVHRERSGESGAEIGKGSKLAKVRGVEGGQVRLRCEDEVQ